jgi:hypothetical protein
MLSPVVVATAAACVLQGAMEVAAAALVLLPAAHLSALLPFLLGVPTKPGISGRHWCQLCSCA